jgi:dihydroflavonol-4-reductase
VRAFVTGGTGFIGGNLIRELLAGGSQVRALARPGSDISNLNGLQLDFVEGDLEDEKLLQRSMQDCEWIFHVAANYSLCRREGKAIYNSNVEGTKRIFRAARAASAKRIVYTSSVAAIGLAPGESIADESTRTTVDALISDYKKSKYLAEDAARSAAKEGIPVLIVNPSTPVGPFDCKPTPTGEIILKFLRRQMPFYVHTGFNVIAVKDVVRGHILAAERGRVGERYILGHKNIKFKELLDLLSSITGLPSPQHALPHWIPITFGYFDELILCRLFSRPPVVTINGAKLSRHPMYYSSNKAVQELGLPQSPIEDALRSAVDWFQKNGYT